MSGSGPSLARFVAFPGKGERLLLLLLCVLMKIWGLSEQQCCGQYLQSLTFHKWRRGRHEQGNAIILQFCFN